MAPNAAMQMALANLLRGGLPQRMASGMGPPPIDSSLPGLPGMDGMAPQMALANALAGKTGEQSPMPVAPPPMGPAAPAAAGLAPAQQGVAEQPEEMDFAQAMSDALGSQRTVSEALKRQRAVGNLGLLTGDKVLSRFGQAQLDQASSGDPNSLRHLSLVQAQQRLAQQAAAEARQGRQGDARLGLAREQYNTQAALGWGNLGQRRQEHVDEVEENKRKAERQRLKDIQDTQDRLRGEFTGNKVIKDLQLSDVSFNTVQELARDPNPASDIAFVYAVMKTFDPTSIVKDTEFATAKNATNVPGRIRNAYNNARHGTLMDPKQRMEFIGAAQAYLDGQRKKAREIAAGYEKTARESGVDPRFVIPEGTISGYSVRAGPPRTTPGSLPTGPDGNPTLDTPAPAAGAASQDGLPPILNVPRGQRAVDLMQEGETRRINMGGGKYRTVIKRGNTLGVIGE